MFARIFPIMAVLAGIVILPSCNSPEVVPTEQAEIANPASVYCEEHSGKLLLVTDEEGGVVGMCEFVDGSQCEEWAYFRGECSPSNQAEITPNPTIEMDEKPAAELITPSPDLSAEYQGWWAYSNPEYSFSIMLPPDWVVDQTTTGDPQMDDHMLNMHPRDEVTNLNIRMAFRRVGEDALLWPTGVGAGELVPQGTVEIAGETAQRVLFVCPNGQINSIYYQGEGEPNIRLEDLEFGFIYSFTDVYCQEGYSIEGKNQSIGEMIISSLQLP